MYNIERLLRICKTVKLPWLLSKPGLSVVGGLTFLFMLAVCLPGGDQQQETESVVVTPVILVQTETSEIVEPSSAAIQSEAVLPVAEADSQAPAEQVESPVEPLAGESPVESLEQEDTTQADRSQSGPTEYVVQSGDSLWVIAKQHNLDVTTLRDANALGERGYIRPGQVLKVPPGKGVYYRVREGDTLWELCRRYRVEESQVMKANEVKQAKAIRVGEELFLPGASPERAVTDFIWPARGRLTSRYGYRQHPMGGGRKMHNGVDVAASTGRLVKAAQSGTVKSAGWRGRLGKAVFLNHRSGYETVYGHNSEILVKVGQKVEQGQPIARIGSTGHSTGPHVHFEVRKNGKSIDPLPFLP
jgi:murein DD-endopeptidase MepM/ murein hydrolase activator NlpD